MNFIFILLILVVVLYIASKRVYYYIIKKILVDYFDADVSFSSAYNFFSLSNLKIQNELGVLTCKHVAINAWDRRRIIFSNIETTFDYSLITKVLGILQHGVLHKDSSLAYLFNWTIILKDVTIFGETNLKLKRAAFSLSSSIFNLKIVDVSYTNDIVNVSIPKFKHTLHYFGKIPKFISFLHPVVEVELVKNQIKARFHAMKAYSKKTPIWRFTSDTCDVVITLLKKDEIGANTNSPIAFSAPQNINLAFQDDQYTISIPYLIGNSRNNIFDIKSSDLSIKYKNITAKSLDVTVHTSILPLLLRPGIFETTTFYIDDFRLKAEIVKNSYIKLVSQNYQQFQGVISSLKGELEFELPHCRPLFINTDKLELDLNRMVKLETFHIKYAFLTDFMEVLKLLNSSPFFNEKFKIITSKGIIENVSLLNTIQLSNAAIDVSKKSQPTIEKSRAMVDSIFPGSINISHVVGVQEFSIMCKAGELISSNLDFTDFEITGMVYLMLLTGEMKQLEFCGMLDIIAKSAHVSMKSARVPKLWMISMDITEAGMLLEHDAITAHNVIGDLNEFRFDSISTSHGITGKLGDLCPLADGRSRCKLDELIINGAHYKKVDLSFQDHYPSKMRAEEMNFGNSVLRDYEFDFSRKEMHSSYGSIDPSQFDFSHTSDFFSFGSISQVDIGKMTLMNVDISTTAGIQVNIQSIETAAGEPFAITADVLNFDIDEAMELHANKLTIESSMKFDINKFFKNVIGWNFSSSIDVLSLKITDGETPLNQAEMKGVNFNINFEESDNDFEVKLEAGSFDFYDVSKEPRLIMYISPGDKVLIGYIKIENFEIIKKCSLGIADCFINATKEDVNVMARVFSPIMPNTIGVPMYFTKVLTIDNMEFKGFPLSMSYFDTSSHLYSSDRFFQFAMPMMIINQRSLSLQNLVYYIMTERQKQVRKMIETTLQRETEVTTEQQTNSSGKVRSGGKK